MPTFTCARYQLLTTITAKFIFANLSSASQSSFLQEPKSLQRANFLGGKSGISSSKTMGNCMESCINSQRGEQQNESQPKNEEKSAEIMKENTSTSKDHQSSGMRIKIVLTKEELEWLLFQLKNQEGKRLEDVLDEIERGRQKSPVAWKPSLESITESPEVPDQMDR